MSVFGWILFVMGFALLILGGFVGMEGIANLPAVQAGGAIMISGSVLTLHANYRLSRVLFGDEQLDDRESGTRPS